MNGEEFNPIAKAIQLRWSAFPIPDEAMVQFVKDLYDLRAEDVAAAVECLGTRERPPSPLQVRQCVVEMQLDAPEWPDARVALGAWADDMPRRQRLLEGWVCPYGRCDGTGFAWLEAARAAARCDCWAERIAAARGLEELPVLIREFIEERVTREEIIALMGGDTTMDAQVRARWEQFVGRIVRSRMLAALPVTAGELPRVASARAEARGRALGGLRRLDPGVPVAGLPPGAAVGSANDQREAQRDADG